MDENRLINVVGAPGSGCSTVGRLVAEKRGMCFLDGDDFSAKVYRVDNSGGIETAVTQLVSLLGGKS